MATYVPGTLENDPKKVIMSLQQLGPGLDTANTNIATNTSNIATNTSNISSNSSAITALQTAGAGLVNSGGSLAVSLSKLTASLGADVTLNNTSNYFDGPSIAQGTSGTWFVSGSVTVLDTTGATGFNAKLWDGTTVIASGTATSAGASYIAHIALSGYITSPAGNLKISVRDENFTTGKIIYNHSGNSKDSTITAVRIA